MNNQHVVPKGDIWQVKGENKMRATKNFDRQSDAIAYGRKIAQNNNSELVINVSPQPQVPVYNNIFLR